MVETKESIASCIKDSSKEERERAHGEETKASTKTNGMMVSSPNPYHRRLSWIVICISVFMAFAGPYLLAKRSIVKSIITPNRSEETWKIGIRSNTTTLQDDFPTPILHKGKKRPNTRYTAQCFGETFLPLSQQQNEQQITIVEDNTDSWSQNRIDVHLDLSSKSEAFDEEDCESDGDHEDNVAYEHKGGPFEPAGQHLLMDIRNVDAGFLVSMKRLVDAMIQVITQSKLTLLSYHCHDLQPPMGISCVGVLLESHVSIHTWPHAGKLSLDLFTCGSQSLLPLIPLLEELFAVPSPSSGAEGNKNVELLEQWLPIVTWSHKKRGYRDYFHDNNGTLISNEEEARELRQQYQKLDSDDIERFLLGWTGGDSAYKTPILQTETQFQKVDIYGVSPADKNKDGKKEQFAEQQGPNKRVFLDGVMQSTLQGLEAYHEALVQPAMTIAKVALDQLNIENSHSPKRVAIIGGGEGATLREVLKHKSVETCVMIEIDEELVQFARQYLPEWNDCSDLVQTMDQNNHSFATETGGKNSRDVFSCFDDPRTSLQVENAIDWFIERFGETDSIKEEDKFDVIIMDALDPATSIDFSDTLYTDTTFVSSLVQALTEHGVLVAQVGISPYHSDLGIHHTFKAKTVARFEQILYETGMTAMKTYTEGHGQFMGPWEFRIAFKNFGAVAAYFRDPALTDLTIVKSAVPTKSKQYPFKYFDGPTWAAMQYPSSVEAAFFCATHPRRSKLCDKVSGYDPDIENIRATALEIKPSLIPNGGRGLFFKKDFPAGSHLAIEQSSWNMQILPDTYNLIEEMRDSDAYDLFDLFHFYFFGYGFASDFYDWPSYHVDSGVATFLNHGCNATYNVGFRTETTELTADPNQYPEEFETSLNDQATLFDPLFDREHFLIESLESLLTDVKAGDEVLGNYVEYLHEDNWAEAITDYKAQCLMQSTGAINRYEDDDDDDEEDD